MTSEPQTTQQAAILVRQIADLDGSYHAKRAPKLAMVRAVEGADAAQWDAAVAAFMAARR